MINHLTLKTKHSNIWNKHFESYRKVPILIIDSVKFEQFSKEVYVFAETKNEGTDESKADLFQMKRNIAVWIKKI